LGSKGISLPSGGKDVIVGVLWDVERLYMVIAVGRKLR
jgi:hypothetical protein